MQSEARFLDDLRRRLARRGRASSKGVRLDVGDDAAVVDVGPGHHVVASTDMLVEHVDFEHAWASWADIGHKAAAVNLSDLAAMGAAGRGLLASVALPPRTPSAAARQLLLALDRCGRRYAAPLIGGDLSATSGPLCISVTALGRLPAGTALRRHAARLGDAVMVSGTLGLAAAGLVGLQAGKRQVTPPRWVTAQLRPRPQIALGLALRRSGLCSACTDVSDGLAKDVEQLAGPGRRVALQLDRLPQLRGVPARWARHWALYGGEDFVLACSAPPAAVPQLQRLARRVGERLTVIGEVSRGRAAPAIGYDHFRQ